eukprot:3390062-Pyramimonas_sp.AAC.1
MEFASLGTWAPVTCSMKLRFTERSGGECSEMARAISPPDSLTGLPGTSCHISGIAVRADARAGREFQERAKR